MYVIWLASHAHRLPHICPGSKPVEKACKDVEHLLQPLQLGQCKESIVGIKVRQQVPYRQAKSPCALLFCCHHRQPVADDDIHNHIEERGGQGVSLGNSVVSLEGRATVPSNSSHCGDTAPLRPEKLERPGDYPPRMPRES